MQPPVIQLDKHDVSLTWMSRQRRRARKILKLATIIVMPFIFAQSLAFASFIYEEALQAASFGVRGAMLAEDQAMAYAAVKDFERLMYQAQWFQEQFGYMAFWSDSAFKQYFGIAAPLQLAGFYSEGKAKGFWKDDVRRYEFGIDPKTMKPRLMDLWKEDATTRLRAYGFKPELLDEDKNCLTCYRNKEVMKQGAKQPAFQRFDKLATMKAE